MKKKRSAGFLTAVSLMVVVALGMAFVFAYNSLFADAERDFYKFPLEQHKRITPKISKESKKISQMKPRDVIVAVNGYPLLKDEYDDWMAMLRVMIYKKVKNNLGEADRVFDEIRVGFVDQFVSERLLIDDAVRHGIMKDDKLCDEMKEELSKAAEQQKKSLETFMKGQGKNAKYIAYQMAERILVKELVTQRIPPVTKVEDTFVSNAQLQVATENAALAATNTLRRQMMEKWRGDLIEGKKSFAEFANEHVADSLFEIGDDGTWDTVSRGELGDATLEELVFAAKEGEILPLREDNDGIDLIMLAKIIPPVRDKAGQIVEVEQRQLSRIRMGKEGLFLRQSDEDMKKDLEMQMQLRAIDAYVQDLATNGLNLVVYPYGNDLF